MIKYANYDDTRKKVSEAFSTALTEQDMTAFPHKIYEQFIATEIDQAAVEEALNAAQSVGFSIVGDAAIDNESGTPVVTIRTAMRDRRNRSIEAAMLYGATFITQRSLESRGSMKAALSEDARLSARQDAAGALSQVKESLEISQMFDRYYAGMRMGSDAERFVQDMFTLSAVFDETFIQERFTPNELTTISYDIDPEMPYELRKDWRKQDVETILKQAPQLDYRVLRDEAFRHSPEGVVLEAAYAKAIGGVTASEYKDSGRRWRGHTEKPVIPLTHFPLIEAIMTSEVSQHRPKSKYDFGPSEVTEFVLNSDSIAAQKSLVESLTHRLPFEQRYVFDGPNELQQKSRVIWHVRNAYETEINPERREAFRNYLLTILEAYQGDGEVASDVREKHVRTVEQSEGHYKSQDTGELQDIVKGILITGLSSDQPETFLRSYYTGKESMQVAVIDNDPLSLSKEDLMLVIIEVVKHVTERSSISTIEDFSQKVFSDHGVAAELATIAKLRIEAIQLGNRPEVEMARRALSPFSSTDEQRANFDDALKPANELYAIATDKMNNLLIDQLEAGVMSGNQQSYYLVREFIKHISFGDMISGHELSASYLRLSEIAKRPEASDQFKGAVLWSMAESTKYAGDQMQQPLVQAILDGYEMLLGPVDAMRIPTYETSNALAAVTHIARQNDVFRYATTEQLDTLGAYKQGLIDISNRALNGAIDKSEVEYDDKNENDWQKDLLSNVKNAADELDAIEGLYKKYLYIERVKVEPLLYYPWVLNQMGDFWQSMNWEVGKGNSPKPDIRALFEVMKDYVDSKLVIKQADEIYDENFDIFQDGHLDGLLFELHRRMVPRSDIQYNSTVWQKGLPFVSNALHFMPIENLRQLADGYSYEPDFVAYISHVLKERES
jgi:hypothetical protein